jgi:general secretion pathway protein J
MRLRPNRRRAADTAGFTLVEMLVAMLLMAMIVGALTTVTAQWLPAWSYGFSRLQRTELMAIGLDRIARDLADAAFISADRKNKSPFFDGADLSVVFVRPAISPNARGGLEIVRISESADQQGRLVARAAAPFAPGQISAGQINFANPVVLIRAPYRLLLAYAGKDRLWKSNWHGEKVLPSAVRLTIRDAATDRPLAASTVVDIHAEVSADCAQSTSDDACGGSKADAGDDKAQGNNATQGNSAMRSE